MGKFIWGLGEGVKIKVTGVRIGTLGDAIDMATCLMRTSLIIRKLICGTDHYHFRNALSDFKGHQKPSHRSPDKMRPSQPKFQPHL